VEENRCLLQGGAELDHGGPDICAIFTENGVEVFQGPVCVGGCLFKIIDQGSQLGACLIDVGQGVRQFRLRVGEHLVGVPQRAADIGAVAVVEDIVDPDHGGLE